MPKPRSNDLTVGAFAARAGVPVSTLHYYEAEGLITAWRTDANHRRYDRAELRRVALIKVAQSVGLSLDEIREALAELPAEGKLTARDWKRVSRHWTARIDAQIANLERLRDQLDNCIGCGCLSMKNCPLYNPEDALGAEGPGPRKWIKNDLARA